MNFRWDKKYLYWGITSFLVIVLSISFFLWLYKFNVFWSGVKYIFNILTPFIYGFAFAYLTDPIMTFMEKRWFTPLFSKSKKKLPQKLARIVSLIISITFGLVVVSGLIIMVLPQLISSIKGIVDSSPTYFKNLEKWALNFFDKNPQIKSMLTQEFEDISKTVTDFLSKRLMPQLDNILSSITSGVFGVLIALKNIFIGIIISIYVLYSKEKFFAQAKKMTYACFSVKSGNGIIKIIRRSHKVFGGFIIGKLIDSLIIGILCFIGMSIFRMPFILLISVIVGVTNIIPFFGPFIGAIPSGLLILMVDPLQAFYFAIFILVLQQFDGNILGPKILGDSTGLSAFWVIFAILVSGSLFGFVGMLIGVPTFAVIYSLIVELAENRLKKHELPVLTSEYDGLDYINTMEHEAVYMEHVDDVKKA